MSDLSQKTLDAYEAGASFSMDESFNLFGAICIGLTLILAAYIILCILKGIGDDTIKKADIPMLLIRSVLIVLVLGSFFFFQ